MLADKLKVILKGQTVPVLLYSKDLTFPVAEVFDSTRGRALLLHCELNVCEITRVS